MSKYPILALVGRSGVGKTTILMELLKHYPDRFFPIKVITNRERRGPEDDVFCTFADASSIQKLRDDGKLVQYLEYAGNIYGCARADIDAALEKGIGVQAYVESGIVDLRAAGYTVIPVKVIGDLHPSPSEKRVMDDAQREETHIDYDLTLTNSLEEGILKKAVDTLARFTEGR